MIDSITRFFSEAGFMPHGHCYLWQPGVLWLHIISDSLITLAYFSIPFTLLYFVRKRRDMEFNWMFVCFAVFIVACGATHLMEIWTIWHPTYWLAGGVKAITALASVPTAILLVKLVPTALRLPSAAVLQQANTDLEREIAERKRAESEVRHMNQELESRVAERTMQLETMNRSLLQEITEREQSEYRQRQQLSQLELLNRITHAVGERQDLPSIFQVVIRSLEDDLPIDFGCICLYDPMAETLTVAHVGIRSNALAMELLLTEHARIPIDRNGLSRCVRGQLVYEPDIGMAPFPFPQQLNRGGLGSLVMAPLLVENTVFGVLIAARRDVRGFSSSECEFLRQLSEHVSLAAHQARVYAALQHAYDDMRQTQRAILQQERLRALGQIASGIAHDINNAISPVTLYTESLLEREPNLSDRARDQITTIQRAIEDVARTVTRMREFYREREPELVLARIDLNRIVKEVIELTRARWKDVPQQKGFVIDLRVELSTDLPATMGAENEIRDALTNLIFNAADAMPEGGSLTLRTVSAGQGDEAVLYTRVEVCDSGVGMDDETRRRCLEPFFTTKGERGTGLGLAMVYGMVQRHSAELEIDSEPGKGTTMRLIFPTAAPATLVAVRLPELPTPVQSLRILIVDDDPMIIRSLKDTLETDGHRVTTADGGQAGIDAFVAAQKRIEPFAAVITDLGMPYIDGRRVAAAVRAASPATPIILLTGWGQRLVADNEVPPQVDRVLSKPPRLRELRTALAELTDPSASAHRL